MGVISPGLTRRSRMGLGTSATALPGQAPENQPWMKGQWTNGRPPNRNRRLTGPCCRGGAEPLQLVPDGPRDILGKLDFKEFSLGCQAD